MTPKDARLFVDSLSVVARQDLDRAADTQVLKETLARLIARQDSRDEADVLKELDATIREKQEKYLLKIEDFQPLLAALMDQSHSQSGPAK